MYRFFLALLLILTCWQMPAHSLGQESLGAEEAVAEEAGHAEHDFGDEHWEEDDRIKTYFQAIFYQLLGVSPLMLIWVVAACFGLYLCGQQRAAAGGCLVGGAALHLIFCPLQLLGESYIYYFDETDIDPELLACLFNMALSLFFVAGWVLVLCSVALMRKPLPANGATGSKS